MSVLFVGHGSKDGQANAIYSVLLERLRADGFPNCALALLSEGALDLALAMRAMPKDEPVKIVPLMVARGRHVMTEIYGDGVSSVKSRLIASGFDVIPCKKTVLEYILEKNLHFALWEDVL